MEQKLMLLRFVRLRKMFILYNNTIASLSHFYPASDGSMLEYQVQLSYGVFVEDSPQVGSVLTRKHAKRTKKVGRPKGSKTKRQKGDKTRKKASPKKRPQKSA